MGRCKECENCAAVLEYRAKHKGNRKKAKSLKRFDNANPCANPTAKRARISEAQLLSAAGSGGAIIRGEVRPVPSAEEAALEPAARGARPKVGSLKEEEYFDREAFYEYVELVGRCADAARESSSADVRLESRTMLPKMRALLRPAAKGEVDFSEATRAGGNVLARWLKHEAAGTRAFIDVDVPDVAQGNDCSSAVENDASDVQNKVSVAQIFVDSCPDFTTGTKDENAVAAENNAQGNDRGPTTATDRKAVSAAQNDDSLVGEHETGIAAAASAAQNNDALIEKYKTRILAVLAVKKGRSSRPGRGGRETIEKYLRPDLETRGLDWDEGLFRSILKRMVKAGELTTNVTGALYILPNHTAPTKREISIKLPTGSLGAGIQKDETTGMCVVSGGSPGCQLRVGDTILSVNGIRLSEVENAGVDAWVAMFAALSSRQRRVVVRRDGPDAGNEAMPKTNVAERENAKPGSHAR